MSLVSGKQIANRIREYPDAGARFYWDASTRRKLLQALIPGALLISVFRPDQDAEENLESHLRFKRLLKRRGMQGYELDAVHYEDGDECISSEFSIAIPSDKPVAVADALASVAINRYQVKTTFLIDPLCEHFGEGEVLEYSYEQELRYYWPWRPVENWRDFLHVFKDWRNRAGMPGARRIHSIGLRRAYDKASARRIKAEGLLTIEE